MAQMERTPGTPPNVALPRPDRILDRAVNFHLLVKKSGVMANDFIASTMTINAENRAAYDLRQEIEKRLSTILNTPGGALIEHGLIVGSQYRAGFPIQIREDEHALDRAAFLIAVARHIEKTKPSK